MTHIATRAARPASASVRFAPAKLARLWIERRRSRAALAALTPELLRDIGLDSATARREAAKPFWRG